MIRVTHVITDTNLGGAGFVLLNLLKNRDRGRFEVTVILPQGSLLKPEAERLCQVVEARYIADRSMSFKALPELCRLLRKQRPDIVHSHASMSARIAAKLFLKDCAIVNTRHSVFDVPDYKKSFPYKILSGFLNNYFSDKIIAVSPAAKTNITDVGTNPEKVEVIFNGVDPVERCSPEKRAEVRRRYGFSETDFVCAIIARLEKVKGHEYIIEACKTLPPGIKVLIAGTGSEETPLKTAAAGLDNCVFAGFLKEIYEIESIMDVQLNASYGTEATSAALLEGMSLGVPAVVSDFGGNPYVIENGINGVVVPRRNSAAIREAILELKDSPRRYKEMSVNAERIFYERFTSKSMTKATENLYRKLVTGN